MRFRQQQNYGYSDNTYKTFAVFEIIVIAISVLIFPLFIGWATGGISYSTGYREGTIQKLSRKGIVWKTNEGELAMQGIRRQSENTMSNIFEFTVLDDNVLNEIEKLHGNEQVRLNYEQFIFTPPWNGSTGYRIVKVEKIKPSKTE